MRFKNIFRYFIAFCLIAVYTQCLSMYRPVNKSIRNKEDKKHIEDVLIKEGSIDLHSKDMDLYSIFDLAVDHTGNVIVTDFYGRKVCVYSQTGEFIKVLAKEGKGPGEVIKPTILHVDTDGNIYVVDNALRRINIFNKKYKFVDSFIIRSRHQQPFCLEKTSNCILMAGANLLKYDLEPGKNIVYNKRPTLINKYDLAGKYKSSFLSVEKEFTGTCLQTDHCWFTVKGDTIFAVQANSYKLHVLNMAGIECECYKIKPKHFKQIKKKEIPLADGKITKAQKNSIISRYSKIMKIINIENYLLLQSSVPFQNGADSENNVTYKIDIVSTEGRMLVSGIHSKNYELRCVDKNNYIYFLKKRIADNFDEKSVYTIEKYKLNVNQLASYEAGL